MKNTNSKEYNEQLSQYLLDCINSEDVELKTDQDKINHLFSRFEKEAGYSHNLKKLPNDQVRLADFLQGLPFDFEYRNHKILELASRLHDCELTEAQEDVILANYWNHLAYKLMRLRKKLNSSTSL